VGHSIVFPLCEALDLMDWLHAGQLNVNSFMKGVQTGLVWVAGQPIFAELPPDDFVGCGRRRQVSGVAGPAKSADAAIC
jgi:hypothetical protein